MRPTCQIRVNQGGGSHGAIAETGEAVAAIGGRALISPQNAAFLDRLEAAR